MSMRSPTTRPIVVSGSHDATVRVWDLDSRGLLYEPLEGHKGTVNAVAVGALGGRPIAVSGGNDRMVWGVGPGGGRPAGWAAGGPRRLDHRGGGRGSSMNGVLVKQAGNRQESRTVLIRETTRPWLLAGACHPARGRP